MENRTDILLITDDKGIILSVSEAAKSLLQLSQCEALIGKNICEYLPVSEYFKDSRQSYFSPIALPSQLDLPFALQVHRMDAGRDSSVNLIFQGVLPDETFLLSEPKYKSLFTDNQSIMLIIEASTGLIKDANTAAIEFYGYSHAVLCTMNISQINTLPEKDIKREIQHASTKKRKVFQFKHRLASGEIKDVEVFSGPIMVNGKEYLYSIVHDITSRKKSEDELRILSRAVEQSPVSIVITDINGQIEYVNPKACQTTGYSYQELIGQNPRVLKSGETSSESYLQLWNTISSKQEWKGIFHNKRKDGVLYWESSSISPISDENGIISHYLAVKEDITERKNQEAEIFELNQTLEEKIIQRTAELNETNQNLSYQIKEKELIEAELILKTRELETFFSVSLDMMCIASIDGHFIKINKAFTRILGYTPEELIERPFFDFLHPEDIQSTRLAMTKLANQEPVYNLVNRYRTKSGVYNYIEWTAYPAGNRIYAAARDITARLEGEKHLQQLRDNYEKFFNTIDEFIWVSDQNLQLLHANQTVFKRLDRSPQELIGNTVYSMHPQNQHPEVRKCFDDMLQGKADLCSIPLITKNGELIPVETRLKQGFWNDEPVYFGVSKDITILQFSEQKFSNAFRVNPALMAISDFETGKFIDVNNAFLDILGFTRDEIIGKSNRDIKLLDDTKVMDSLLPKLDNGLPARKVVINMLTKAGEVRIGMLSAEIIHIASLKCLLTITVDITEQKQAEEELVKARKEADSANQAKSEFLSRMSHELRTPLNSILGFAQLLELTDIPQAQKKDVRQIMNSGWHLLDLINEVLDISKIEAGKLSLTIEPIQIRWMVEEMIDFMKTQAAAKQITILMTDNLLPDLLIKADRQRTRQVFLNLLNNAIKYNKDGGSITIDATPGRTSAQQTSFLKISIQDTGMGIHPDYLNKLFIPFERIGGEKYAVEGTGLGLTVVKKLIDAMGGDLGVESVYGEGSTFWFELPLANDQQIEQTEVRSHPVINQAINSNSAGKVLYIEDNPANVALADQILIMHRPLVQLLSNSYGVHAVNLARAHQVNLILLNLDLANMNGLEIIKALQDNPATISIPIIITCSEAPESMINQAYVAGVKGALSKPVNVPEFLAMIDEFVLHQTPE